MTDPKMPKPASEATLKANAALAAKLDFEYRRDFENASRGHVADLEGGVITTPKGTKVWDLNEYDFLNGDEDIDTINPSLLRMSRLNMATGLFEVCDRVWQVRGLDIANMTIVEGETGIIVLDAMLTAEVAAAALKLYRDHRGERP